MTLWAHGRTHVQPELQAHRSNLASARYEILDIRAFARNTIAAIFLCIGSMISLVPIVQGYVKSKCLGQMGICAVWSAPLFSRYIDRISLDQVCNGVG